MNSVQLIGRLTKNLELKNTASGTSAVQFSLAVDRPKDGTDFISCVAYGKTAENMERYLRKGSKIGIEGRIQTRNYEGRSGKVYVTEVICSTVHFLDPR